MTIIQRGLDKRQSIDVLKVVIRHFMSKVSDQAKRDISETIDWYSLQDEVVFDAKIETFPELGMLGRLTIELKPVVRQ